MTRLQCTYRQAHQAANKIFGPGMRTGEWQFEFFLDNKLQFKVTIPDSHGHGTELIPPGTLKSVQSQLRLDREEFDRWRDCPLDRAEYEQIIRAKLNLP